MRWAVVIAILSCAAPFSARAQDTAREDVGPQESLLEDARLAPVRDRLASSIDAARREDLPAEWLLDKVAEGLSKRVPSPRIAAAVETLLDRIRVADGMVRPALVGQPARRTRLLRAAVDALAAGAPREPLGRLIRDVARGDRAHAADRVHEALTTVAELAERQFGGPAAVEATLEAHRRGERPSDLLRRARRIGRDPPGGRDGALRQLGRRGDPRSGVDVHGAGRDHGRDENPGRGHR